MIIFLENDPFIENIDFKNSFFLQNTNFQRTWIQK